MEEQVARGPSPDAWPARAPLLLPLAALSQRISLWFGTFSCPARARILGGFVPF